jgi:hypothetical protein
VDGYREAIPKPQLAEVGIEQEVSLAAISKIAITVAGNQPLIELCQSRRECDAMFFQPNPAAGPIAGECITVHPTDWPGRISFDSGFTASLCFLRRQRTNDEDRQQGRKLHFDELHFHVFPVNKTSKRFYTAKYDVSRAPSNAHAETLRTEIHRMTG